MSSAEVLPKIEPLEPESPLISITDQVRGSLSSLGVPVDPKRTDAQRAFLEKYFDSKKPNEAANDNKAPVALAA